MAKVKYYYDEETLSYRQIKESKKQKARFIVMAILGCFLGGFILLLIFLNLPQIDTPKEKILARELENMELQYSILDKKMSQAEEVLKGVEDRDDNIYRIYFEANPISKAERGSGFGGVNRYEDLEGYDSSKLIVGVNKRMDKLQKRIVVESKSLDEIAKLAKGKEKLLAAMPAIQPIENKDLRFISSGYGYRYHPILKIRRMHSGIDFASNFGANVYATADGVVKRVTRVGGYGNMIEVEHGFGYTTRYAHLSKMNVQQGQKVKRGQVIGEVGSTGISTGPHVHYEVHKNGQTVNPINYFHGDLTSEEYAILLKKSELENQSMD